MLFVYLRQIATWQYVLAYVEKVVKTEEPDFGCD